MTEISILCLFALSAGLVDAIAGGGGLIQLPALLIFLPQFPVATLFGTNKFASIAGTSIAATQYARHIEINLRATLPATCVALVFSFLGARTVTVIDPKILRPVIFLLLIGIAIYSFLRKDFGLLHAPRLRPSAQFILSILTGASLGFYDGFFGPGTGSFLIFVFIGIFGFSFLSASASSKLINFATNLSALLYFGFTGHIFYKAAIAMALFNMLGSVIGTRMAILKGNRFVRVFFLIIVCALIARLGYDLLKSV
jgi:uncharacterized protein